MNLLVERSVKRKGAREWKARGIGVCSVHTWLVQTLLKVTNAKVWASIVDGRSFFARIRGRAMAERKSCGMKARDSRFRWRGEGNDGDEEFRVEEEEDR